MDSENKRCTFFGHRNTQDEIRPVLLHTIRALIENRNVTTFYVGDKGAYDRMAASCVRELRKEYPYIRLYIVLAYMPGKKQEFEKEDPDTIYPDGLEMVPPRFAITHRNRWMADRSDYAVVNICARGGAADAAAYADHKGVKILNLSQAYSAQYFPFRNTFTNTEEDAQ